MSTAEKVESGVYRNGTGHTIVINRFHPDEMGLPDGYVRLASEEEFAEGRFHPYALPGQEPEGWTPETAAHGTGTAPGAVEFVPGLSLEELPADVKADLVDQVKAELGDVVTKQESEKALQAAVKAANVDADKKIKAVTDGLQSTIDAAVAKAVEAATK